MKVHFAGITAGNIKPFWNTMSQIYLSGIYSREFVIKEAMKLYLAGIQGPAKSFVFNNYKPYILESFYYIQKHNQWVIDTRDFFKDFLLDSGAFTFMNNVKDNNINYDKYLEEYAAFINRHDIDKFFELDIDSVVGYKEVLRLRNKLESLTNRQCIPVWHKSRGLDEWNKMVSEYDYVAIGGIVTKEIKPNQYDIFYKLLDIAKKNNCKVHGLGFTNLEGLKKYKFYSVDSTAWLYGNRGGFVYRFNGSGFDKHKVDNSRLKGREAAIHNFNEWLKFSEYAETNL